MEVGKSASGADSIPAVAVVENVDLLLSRDLIRIPDSACALTDIPFASTALLPANHA